MKTLIALLIALTCSPASAGERWVSRPGTAYFINGQLIGVCDSQRCCSPSQIVWGQPPGYGSDQLYRRYDRIREPWNQPVDNRKYILSW